MIALLLHKVERLLRSEQIEGGNPSYTVCGRWWLKPLDHPDFWDLGFFVGILYKIFLKTGEAFLRKSVLRLVRKLEEREFPLNHNLGFLFFYAFVPAYLETGSKRLKRKIVGEARKLASIFDRKLGFIPMDYPNNDKIAVDTLAALELLWWAAEETKEQFFWDVAYSHASKSLELLLRKDGSTRHIFSLARGSLAGQGLSASSCWSRGAAWGALGFLRAYKETGENSFREASYRILKYAMRRVGEDGVPPWDFHSKDGVKDTSAGAIFLKVLSSFNGEFSIWRRALKSSLRGRYLALDEKWEGFIKEGCYHYHWKRGVGESLIWGDYFALEAIEDMI